MKKRNYEIAEIEEDALANIQGMAQRLLHAKKMKNKDLAKAMDVSEAHVSKLLNGDDPTNLTIKAAARLFHGLGEELVFTCAGIEALDRAVRAKNGHVRFELCDATSWHTTKETKKQSEPSVDELVPAA
ncbi:MAG: XRE family transcriptional regulator [Proteobacteria bacterium]|nr:MAG: XRE family transcriptional regulator [Pseudomonadota bacterium]